jgi:UDPglucose--hexose-1-phosphate uridylyltransferase
MANCYFCAGNESHTPLATATVTDADGRWRVRVVPNKYPAVTADAAESGAFGAHEVIIESPDHVLGLVDLNVEQLALILRIYRDRLAHWAADARFKHVVLFKNSGYDAGASLEHVHSQLVALPYVPAAVQAELDAAAAYRKGHGRCVFCDLIERERESRERVITDASGYLAVAAYAPRQPYETWLLPVRHTARFERLTDDELADQADILHDLLQCLDAVSPGAPSPPTTCSSTPARSTATTRSTGTGSSCRGSRTKPASNGGAASTSSPYPPNERRSASARQCRPAILAGRAPCHLEVCRGVRHAY